MKAKTILIILGVLVVLALGTYWYFDEVKGYPAPWQEQKQEQKAALANPASTNCVATLGGQLEIKDTASGQIGICHLPDGRSCEEWALFRDGVCSDGTQPTGAPPGDGSSVSSNFALGIDGAPALGSYLVAYNGMTVYSYAKDPANASTCTGACAANWPPYTVPAGSTLNLQAGVKGAIATIKRADGTTQVTYKGVPLYFYAQDKLSGDIKGQAVGGVWYVVKP